MSVHHCVWRVRVLTAHNLYNLPVYIILTFDYRVGTGYLMVLSNISQEYSLNSLLTGTWTPWLRHLEHLGFREPPTVDCTNPFLEHWSISWSAPLVLHELAAVGAIDRLPIICRLPLLAVMLVLAMALWSDTGAALVVVVVVCCVDAIPSGDVMGISLISRPRSVSNNFI